MKNKKTTFLVLIVFAWVLYITTPIKNITLANESLLTSSKIESALAIDSKLNINENTTNEPTVNESDLYVYIKSNIDLDTTTKSALDIFMYQPMLSSATSTSSGYISLDVNDAGELSGGILDGSGVLVIPEEYDGKTITFIKKEAFKDSNLTSVTIPDTVTIIGASAFRNNSLTSVHIPDSVLEISGYAFQNNNLTTVNIPYGVKKIESYTFTQNKLLSVTIPDSVESIGNAAFSDNSLENLIIPNSVESIGNYSFSSNNLTSVTLPDNLKLIGTSVFEKNNLTNVTIPDSVTKIDSYAFSENDLTSITIPDGVSTIGEYAFSDNKLTSVTIPDGVTIIKKGVFNNNDLTSITIPDNVTSLGEKAFASNSLTSVTLPNGLETIGNTCFYQNELTSIDLPDSLISIGDSAFKYNALTSITIPNSVTTLGSSAFSENELTSVEIPDNLEKINTRCFEKNLLKTVILPDGIISIGTSAFAENNIESIDIPDSVTTIDSYAFSKNELESIYIPDSVISIGRYAFASNNLKSASLPNKLTEITDNCFYENDLTSIIIPDSVISIEENAFKGNSLETVTIGNSVETIGADAFIENNLTSLVLPDSLISIGSNAFEKNALETVIIGNSLKTIGRYAFAENNLEVINLPDSVTSISNYAFEKNRLINVNIPDSVTSIDSVTFSYQSIYDKNGIKISDSDSWYDNIEKTGIPSKINKSGHWFLDYDIPLDIKLEADESYSGVTTIGSFTQYDDFEKYLGTATKPRYTNVGWEIVSSETLEFAGERYIVNDIETKPIFEGIPYELNIETKKSGIVIDITSLDGTFSDTHKLIYGTNNILIPYEGDIEINASKDGYYTMPINLTTTYDDRGILNIDLIPIPFNFNISTKQDNVTFDLYKIGAGETYIGSDTLNVSDGVKTTSYIDFGVFKLVASHPSYDEMVYYITMHYDDSIDIEIDFVSSSKPHYIIVEDVIYWLNTSGEVIVVGLDKPRENVIIYSYVDIYEDGTADDKVSYITVRAFKDENIKKLTIEEGITEINEYAFENNEIESISLPNSLLQIGQYAFANNNINNVTIPSGLNSIEKGVFSNNNFTDINIPSNINKIEEGAFLKNNLIYVNIPSTVSEVKSFAFNNNLFNSSDWYTSVDTNGVGSEVTGSGEWFLGYDIEPILELDGGIYTKKSIIRSWSLLNIDSISKKLLEPIKSKHLFEGWEIAGTPTTIEYNGEKYIVGDIKLKATWEENDSIDDGTDGTNGNDTSNDGGNNRRKDEKDKIDKTDEKDDDTVIEPDTNVPTSNEEAIINYSKNRIDSILNFESYRIYIDTNVIDVKYNDGHSEVIESYVNSYINPNTYSTMISLRSFVELGGEDVKINWYQDKQQAEVIFKEDEVKVVFTLNDNIFELNNVKIEMKNAYGQKVYTEMIDNRLLIPLRFINEYLGYEVIYEKDTNSVLISE